MGEKNDFQVEAIHELPLQPVVLRKFYSLVAITNYVSIEKT
ncbi:MAG: hypothetical protein V7K30_23055 [Nostoc sp.]